MKGKAMKRECGRCDKDFYVPSSSVWVICLPCRRETRQRTPEEYALARAIAALPTWDGPVIGEDDAP